MCKVLVFLAFLLSLGLMRKLENTEQSTVDVSYSLRAMVHNSIKGKMWSSKVF